MCVCLCVFVTHFSHYGGWHIIVVLFFLKLSIFSFFFPFEYSVCKVTVRRKFSPIFYQFSKFFVIYL